MRPYLEMPLEPSRKAKDAAERFPRPFALPFFFLPPKRPFSGSHARPIRRGTPCLDVLETNAGRKEKPLTRLLLSESGAY